jgi:hypothetical protein
MLALSAALPMAAQDSLSSYRVEFRIRDGSDAAAKTGRRYAMLLDNAGKGTFKIGERVPVVSGPNGQVNYLDVGVNIDAKIGRQEDRMALSSTLDMSTVVEHKTAAGSAVAANPTVAQIRIDIRAMVPIGKPMVVASVDDPVTQHKLDVEALIVKAD